MLTWREVVAHRQFGKREQMRWLNTRHCPVGDALIRAGFQTHDTWQFAQDWHACNRGTTMDETGYSAQIFTALLCRQWAEADRILDQIDDQALALKRAQR